MSRITFAAILLLAVSSSSPAQQAAFSANDTGPAPDAIFETKDAAALTAGIVPLSKSDLRQAETEVRIWDFRFCNPPDPVMIYHNGSQSCRRPRLWGGHWYKT